MCIPSRLVLGNGPYSSCHRILMHTYFAKDLLWLAVKCPTENSLFRWDAVHAPQHALTAEHITCHPGDKDTETRHGPNLSQILAKAASYS